MKKLSLKKIHDIDFEESERYYIGNNTYYVIHDYDIRFYNNKVHYFLEINTYPNNPKKILSCICKIESFN